MKLRVSILAAVLAAFGCAAALAAERVSTVPVAGCRDGGPGAAPEAGRDVELGPLAILFAGRSPRDRRGAFDGHGWKLPASLVAGGDVTLVVPRRLRDRVGLVYTLGTQAQVLRRGVRAADSRVTFRACAGPEAPARTGWPGGIVVDRRRCARLRVRVEGSGELIERRVPLGKPCAKSAH
jgi:hypothetical protein